VELDLVGPAAPAGACRAGRPAAVGPGGIDPESSEVGHGIVLSVEEKARKNVDLNKS
jgi:hypothetical protein